jgi:hypothetical protein
VANATSAEFNDRRQRLARAIAQPYISFGQRAIIAIGVSSGIAVNIAVAVRNPFLALALSLVASVSVTVLLLRPAWDPDFRAAAAMFYEHVTAERSEWRRATGSSMPRGDGAMTRWLVAHPDPPERLWILLVLGRFEEADRAIEALEPATPKQAFEQEDARMFSALLAGRPTDLSRLRIRWADLDADDKRLKGECVATLEAQIAFDRGEDPTPVLAAGWRRLPGKPAISGTTWRFYLFPIIGIPLVASLLTSLLKP